MSKIDPPWWCNGHHDMRKLAEYINPAPVVRAVVVCVAGALWEGCGQGSEHVSKARVACAVQPTLSTAKHSLLQGWSLQLHQAARRTII